MKIGQLLGVGNTANVYEWGKSEVIKVFHDRLDAMHEAAKEARNAEVISRLNVRAPGFSGMVEYEGKPCLVYEKIAGPVMLACIEPTELSVSYHAELMAQMHFELHRVEIDSPSNLITEISKGIAVADDITDQEKSMVLKFVGELPDGQVLCHYDFHPGNIVLSPNGPVIIDWLNALIGHPAADVARTFMMLDSHALPPNPPAWLIERFESRKLFKEKYLAEYFKLSGMNRSAIDEWLVPTFAARISELRGEDRLEIISKLQSRLKLY